MTQLAVRHPKLDERPFDYERKFASVLVKSGHENLLLVKGSIDDVCGRCRYAAYKGRRSRMETDGSSSVHAVVDEMLEDGMKVLAVALKPLDQDRLSAEDEHDLIL